MFPIPLSFKKAKSIKPLLFKVQSSIWRPEGTQFVVYWKTAWGTTILVRCYSFPSFFMIIIKYTLFKDVCPQFSLTAW